MAQASFTVPTRARSFRVWLPPAYDDTVPAPVVFLMHGGFGSGEQVETSSRMLAAAATAGFIVVSPNGLANPSLPTARTWNADGYCGYAAANVPVEGGFGCGPSGVSYRSLEGTLQAWLARDGCAATTSTSRVVGDAYACTTFAPCSPGGLVESCVIDGGGHQWPGGEPPSTAGLGSCPFGYQSQLYPASERILAFFEESAPR